MDHGVIENVFRKASGGDMLLVKPKKGHTTGIGINNVIQRLRIYFKEEDVINIYSAKGRGTKVIIRIPADGGSRKCINS